MNSVLIVPTGTANLASVSAALRRLGAEPRLASDPAEIARASRVLLPGVGALKAAMETLEAKGFADPLRERFHADRPTLAICLGLQLMAEWSEESPGTPGLGLFRGTVRRLPENVRVPHFGWNRVEPEAPGRFLFPIVAYFANSYALTETPSGFLGAVTRHGSEFVSALERGSWLACQFHPELSGPCGMRLIRRWLDQVPFGTEAAC